MKKLIILLAAFIFTSAVFAEEAKVEVAKPAEAAASDEAGKAVPTSTEDTKKADEAVASDAKKVEPVKELKKEVKAVKAVAPAKKEKHSAKKHKSSKPYTVVAPKKFTVVPVK